MTTTISPTYSLPLHPGSSPSPMSSPNHRCYQKSSSPSSPLSSPTMVVPLNVPTGALYIRSSESIKSALSPTFHMTHRHRDVRCRLAASQYKASRLKGLKEATQRKLSAQQAMADTCLHENDVLMRVVDAGRGGFGIIDAIALAQAARDSLVAEAHTAVTKVKECELKLEVLRDSVEEAQARVEEANQQLGMLMEVIDSAGIHIPAAYRQSSPSSSTLGTQLSHTKDVVPAEQLEETDDGSSN